MTHSKLIARLEGEVEWRIIPDWPYEASNTGLLRNSITKKHLKFSISHSGYERCTFQTNKNRRYVRVHRAVVEAWIGHIPQGMEVNHIDGNKRNNAIENLEIVTGEENNRHAVVNGLKASGERHGLKTMPHRIARGEKAGAAKLTRDQVLIIRQMRDSGKTLSSIAKQFGVDQSLVFQISKRKIWTHI